MERKSIKIKAAVRLFQKGIYRHYKGNYYELIDIVNHSETLEKMVLYRALYGEKELWVRPASMWNEKIIVDSKEVKRFELVEKSETHFLKNRR